MLQKFLEFNRRLCLRIAVRLPHLDSIHVAYENLIDEQSRPGSIVLDVGAGSESPLLPYHYGKGVQLVAVDRSESLLRNNRAAQGRVVADLSRGLPFRSQSVDVIISRAAL